MGDEILVTTVLQAMKKIIHQKKSTKKVWDGQLLLKPVKVSILQKVRFHLIVLIMKGTSALNEGKEVERNTARNEITPQAMTPKFVKDQEVLKNMAKNRNQEDPHENLQKKEDNCHLLNQMQNSLNKTQLLQNVQAGNDFTQGRSRV